MPTPTEAECAEMRRVISMVGDKHLLMIIWAALNGVNRFETFQRQLGIPRAMLSRRLNRLMDDGILQKRPVSPGGRRLGYYLTEQGAAVGPILEGIRQWHGEQVH